MTIAGFQDFWVAGARFYFERDPVAGVAQPLLDLGICQQASPQVASEKIELFDPDGGKLKLADQRTTKITEAYDLTISNLNLDNLSFALLANPPKDFSQTQESFVAQHFAHPGRLVKVHDADADKTPLYRLFGVSGIVKGAVTSKALVSTGDAIHAPSKTIKITGNHAALPELQPGKFVVLSSTGLSNPIQALTYSVASVTNNGANTDIVVVEPMVATETNVTGGLLYHATSASGGDLVLSPYDEWDVPSMARGIVRVLPSVNFSSAASVIVIGTKAAYSGRRLINPQDVTGEILGNGLLVLSRGNFGEESAREARVAINPSSVNFASDNYSTVVFSVRVLADTTKPVPAGRLVQYKGSIPQSS